MMYKLGNLRNRGYFKKKSATDNFKVSLYKMLHLKMTLTDNAKKEIAISNFMKDLEKSQHYTKEDMISGLEVYEGIINKLRQEDVTPIKGDIRAMYSIITSKNLSKEEEDMPQDKIPNEQSREQLNEILDILENNISQLYSIMVNNEPRTAAPKKEDERRVHYNTLLKGYRLVGEILSKNQLSFNQLIGNLVLVSDLNNYCASAWKDTLEELLVTHKQDVYKILGDEVKIADEKDKIRKRLDEVFFEARQKVAKDIGYACIAQNNIHVSYRPHCLDVYTKYLNARFGFNLPETQLGDSYIDESMHDALLDMLKEYLEDVDINELVVKEAVSKYSEILRGVNAQAAQNEIVDWSYTYMENNGLSEKMDRNEFLSDYVYDDMLINIRKIAIEEIMCDKGYITKSKISQKHISLSNSIQKSLEYSQRDDDMDNVKRSITEYIEKAKYIDDILVIFDGIIKSDKWRDCEELIQKCIICAGNENYKLIKETMEISNLEVCKVMVKNGVNLHIPDEEGGTLLMYACAYQDKNFIQYLIDEHIGVNIKSNKQVTALHIAANRGKKDVVDCLIKNGANLDPVQNNGSTPLMYASNGGHIDVVNSLVKNGANIHLKNKEGDTALLIASRKGHLDVVRYFIKRGANINELDNYGNTPLILAAMNGDPYMVEYLMVNGANFEIRNNDGYSALSVACTNGNIYVVQKLIENGASVGELNGFGEDLLTIAANNGNLKIVEYLLEKGASLYKDELQQKILIKNIVNKKDIKMAKLLLNEGIYVDIKDKDVISYLMKEGAGINLLISATINNNRPLVEYLIARGVDVNMENEVHNTPLMYACASGNIDTVKCLVQHGADINMTDPEGITILMNVCYSGDIEMVKYLVEKGVNIEIKNKENETALIYAISGGNLEIVNYLLDKGANKDIRNIDGDTLLINVCSNGRMDIAKCLIERGMDIDAQNNKGQTALMYAAALGELEIVEYLLEQGANINKVNMGKETALMYAVSIGDIDIVERLVRNGANLDMQNDNKDTALMFAASEGELGIVKYLIRRGANLDIANKNNRTALMSAVSKGELGVVEYLVRKGANLDIQDKNKETALMYAVLEEDPDVVEYLIEQGANMELVNMDGKTAEDMAIYQDNSHTISVFEQKRLKDIYVSEVINNKNWDMLDKLIRNGLSLRSIKSVYYNLGKDYSWYVIKSFYNNNNDIQKSIKDGIKLVDMLDEERFDDIKKSLTANRHDIVYNKVILLGLGCLGEQELKAEGKRAKMALMREAIENLESMRYKDLLKWAVKTNNLNVVNVIIREDAVFVKDLEDKNFSEIIKSIRNREILRRLEQYRERIKPQIERELKNKKGIERG